MFIDIYAIQNVPPSNINRDDTGSPKTAMYGGALRARVSSQAWKRAMRNMFANLLPEGSLGIRTKYVVQILSERIQDLRPELGERAEELAKAVLDAVGIKVKSSKRKGADSEVPETGYLLFIGASELDRLSKIALAWQDEGVDIKKIDKGRKKEIAEAFKGHQAVDVALFGRMVADAPDFNSDASAQVAHAISVDRIVQEYDYFTAVDDCASEDNSGAAMIGTIDYNSSTLYRYATVNVDALYEQLGDTDAASRACRAFVDAFTRSMPTGKQNTFANRTLPSTLCVAVRDDQPVNVVGAFENPVRPSEEASISERAAYRLAHELLKIEDMYALPARERWYSTIEELDALTLDAFGLPIAFPQLLDNVEQCVASHCGQKEA